MRTTFLAALALTAIVAVPGLARASQSDANTAVALCRAEVSSQAGVSGDALRLTQVRAGLRAVRVQFDLWRNGQQQGVDCNVERQNGALQIASITPPLATTTVAAAGH
jgi:hypothetical protein